MQRFCSSCWVYFVFNRTVFMVVPSEWCYKNKQAKFNLKCLGHATVSGKMKSNATFADLLSVKTNSAFILLLHHQSELVSTTCLFPQIPSFVRVMLSQFLFFTTLKIQSIQVCHQSRLNKRCIFFTVILFPYHLSVFAQKHIKQTVKMLLYHSCTAGWRLCETVTCIQVETCTMLTHPCHPLPPTATR